MSLVVANKGPDSGIDQVTHFFLVVVGELLAQAPPTNLVSDAPVTSVIVRAAVASDPSGEGDVLRHDGDSLAVDAAQVDVLEEADEVRLGSFLECLQRGHLEPE